MVTTAKINPSIVPTTWESYLKWVLDIDMKLRKEGQCKPSGGTTSQNTAKDPNAMDIDNMHKPKKLAEEWLAKGLCFRCGKHKALKNNNVTKDYKTLLHSGA